MVFNYFHIILLLVTSTIAVNWTADNDTSNIGLLGQVVNRRSNGTLSGITIVGDNVYYTQDYRYAINNGISIDNVPVLRSDQYRNFGNQEPQIRSAVAQFLNDKNARLDERSGPSDLHIDI
ncbi:unnamed protein product [Debaryomyces tyrocola]|nr:unnamed protein product [Debaryomyces tyrocola]